MKFLVILASLLCISNAQTSTGCPYNNQYMIQDGNTFWQLGGSTWAGMCAWLNANPGVNPCTLKSGQCVYAPVSGYTSTTCNSADLAWSCVSSNGYPTGTYYGSGYYSGPSYSTSVSSYCGYNQRQVASGDTIWNIAGQTWANTCAWLNANPGVNPCTLQAGQCLNAPTTSTSTACQSSFSAYSCLGSVPYWSGSGSYCPYTVQSGNTYWSLGGSTWAGTCAWLNANPGVDPCSLQVGQCLNTPTSYTSRTCSSLPSCFSGYSASTCSGCYSTYTVQSGTTYYGLVSRYTSDPTTINNCLAQIEACNPSYVSTNLQVGQTLCLPACASGYYGK